MVSGPLELQGPFLGLIFSLFRATPYMYMSRGVASRKNMKLEDLQEGHAVIDQG